MDIIQWTILEEKSLDFSGNYEAYSSGHFLGESSGHCLVDSSGQ